MKKKNKLNSAAQVGLIVAMGAKTIRRVVTASMVGTSLAVILAVGGCTSSHCGVAACIDDIDQDGFLAGDDCNDRDPSINPDATEVQCDGIDQDCDGADLCETITNTCVDEDGDGYGMGFCAERDCDDSDPNINPNADEIQCDGIDQDCDGADLCEPVTNTCVDEDGDGYGEGFCEYDCNDSDPNINSGVEEDPCPDGIDQDCDGVDGDPTVRCAPEDRDRDGYPAGVDCDDTNHLIHPGQQEPPCSDGVDQNCDGQDSPLRCAIQDADGDGHAAYADCNDNDPSIYPGAPEQCCDAIDSDCDSNLDPWDEPCLALCPAPADADGDGYVGDADCDDTDPNIHVNAEEICDGIDNDCDGVLDIDDNDNQCIINGMADLPDDGYEVV